MSIRFGRSIKIAKGLRVNVSKSGLGLSVGPRGASLSLGSKGVYANVGLPGSGMSMRQKIGSSNYGNSQSSTQSYDDTSITVKISIDEESGKETINLETGDGSIINDESLLRKIKRSDAFKNKLEEMRQKAQNEITEKTEKLINIYLNSEKIVTLAEVKNMINTLCPLKYEKEIYSIQPTSRGYLDNELASKAKMEIFSWKFWQINKMREQFVKDNIELKYKESYSRWLDGKEKFDNAEQLKQDELNSKYLHNYEEQKKIVERIVLGDDVYITETLEDIISDIQLPLDFTLSYQIKNAMVEIDLDLPEIENYPTNKSEILQSGKLSIKKKNQNELFKDYATSVFGLAFYFASIIYNISPAIQVVKIAGYTQRINKKSGNIEDQYVYSIEFDRSSFSLLNLQNIDPIEAVNNFPNKKNVSAKFELKTIEI